MTFSRSSRLKEYIEKDYPIELLHVKDEEVDDEYYIAFHPDFGASACSSAGESKEEALEGLELVRRDIIASL